MEEAGLKRSIKVNRDRFVLSNGHACVLQYILLHLLGYKVTLDDLKQFRQIGSITPGHPEFGVTDGSQYSFSARNLITLLTFRYQSKVWRLAVHQHDS